MTGEHTHGVNMSVQESQSVLEYGKGFESFLFTRNMAFVSPRHLFVCTNDMAHSESMSVQEYLAVLQQRYPRAQETYEQYLVSLISVPRALKLLIVSNATPEMRQDLAGQSGGWKSAAQQIDQSIIPRDNRVDWNIIIHNSQNVLSDQQYGLFPCSF